MKMMIVIVKDHDADPLTHALTEAKYRFTRVASTGGFLRSGVATLLIGVEDGQVDSAIGLIRTTAAGFSAEKTRATLFVVPVERFEQV
jgi:uncharacterized protein YaaQ